MTQATEAAPKDIIKTDLCVIGAGSGGLSVAAGAVQMGARVVLLEGDRMGGDCLNHGCVPSKSLLAAAKLAHSRGEGAEMGVAPAGAEVDFAAVKDHVRAVIDGIAPHDSVERFEGLGVQVIPEYGRFLSPRRVQAGPHVIEARRFVIATGATPLVPPITGLEAVPYFTNESIFDLRTLPDHLIVIGGGPIGMELAQAHCRLGASVTVLEGRRAFAKDDPEMAAIALRRIRAEGVRVLEGAMVASVRGKKGKITIETGDGQTITGSHLLLAVGRRPNIKSLDLEAAGIAHTPTGITVDKGLRTSNRRTYAIGDVAGGMHFTHLAGYHAGIVIRSALFGLPARARTAHIPWATYTDPELSHVGLSEAEARAQYGAKLEVVRFPFAENDRARAERKTEGLIKVMVVKSRPVGVSIVGHQAGELIALWSMAIANGLKMGQIAGMVAPYPTISEINKRAAGAYFTPRLFENDRLKAFVRFIQRF